MAELPITNETNQPNKSMISKSDKSRKAPDVTHKTEKLLRAKAGNFCSFPGCNTYLLKDESVFGEVCHIIAEKPDGPRGDPNELILPLRDRNKIENLILLCNNHHTVIDDKANLHIYTYKYLRQIKNEHERAVEENRLDQRANQNKVQTDKRKPSKRSIKEQYKNIALEITLRADFDKWEHWLNSLVFTSACIDEKYIDNNLSELSDWLSRQIWTDEQYPLVIEAFHNFHRVLNALLNFLAANASTHILHIDTPDEWYVYAISKPDPYVRDVYGYEFYQKAKNHYQAKSSVARALVQELTRAANYLCDAVRDNLDPHFRLKEGYLSVADTPPKELRYDLDKNVFPFPGFEEFRKRLWWVSPEYQIVATEMFKD